MRSLLRNITLDSIGRIKNIAPGIHILNSHYLGINDIPASIFHDLLNSLSKKAELISIENALDLIDNKQTKNKTCIAFTFDDGFEECYTKVAPVLEQFNTNALFFINPGFIDGDSSYISDFQKNKVHVNKKPMTWLQIKELKERGFIIGNHTYDHLKLLDLKESQYKHQIINSKEKIELELNSSCDYFAWTYGAMNDISEEALKIALENHKFIFSCDNYKQYYSNNNNQIINRRHIEGNWPISHVKYFLSKGKKY